MKKLSFVTIFVLFALCVRLTAADVFSFVPADSVAVMKIHPSLILKRPDVAGYLSMPAVAAKRLEFSRMVGCSIEDVKNIVAALSIGGDGVMLVEFSKPVDIASAISKTKAPLTPFKVGKYTMYYGADRAGLAQMAPDIVMMGDAGDVKNALQGAFGVTAFLRQAIAGVDRTACAAYLAVAIDGEMTGNAVYDFCGPDLADHKIDARFTFNDAETAKQMSRMVPMYAGMVSGLAFGDAPELGAEVIKSLKTGRKDNTLTLFLTIPKSLADSIVNYAAQKGQKYGDAGNKTPGKAASKR